MSYHFDMRWQHSTLSWLSVFAVLAAALAVRFLWLESGMAPFACGGSWQPQAGWDCVAKFLLVQSFIEERAGVLAAGLALLGLTTRRWGWLHAALLTGIYATVFYGATFGVPVIIAVLPPWLSRVAGSAPPAVLPPATAAPERSSAP